ncbi:MAG TPA: hypothetical protein VFQ85_16845 [Mycobacteriales bacterium]|jgi:hypothetical protein|nr:hypothetical protein [Mycobacteriales bacterium]
MRVYVGLVRSALAAARDAGELGPAPLAAFAVTPALRESYATADAEELEYAALLAAAESCLPLLAASPAEPRRRFVAACDVPDEAVTPDPEPGPAGVAVTSAIRWRDVKALHADDPAAAATVAAAADAYAAARAGDDDARFAVDEADGWELMWFATQEADDLLG